jgi:nitroimidazol reductase NimA-like FMN-containing flavoprotein (pyridoxamine 5'-phosphate oxidase superfamily)
VGLFSPLDRFFDAPWGEVMGKRPLGLAEIEKFLNDGQVGSLATIGADGPYVTAVNYVHWNGKIYFHGRKWGRKMENIAHDQRVSFLVYAVDGYKRGATACATSTLYKSVIISGRAKVVEGELAENALKLLGEKFSPGLGDYSIPLDKLAITAVVEIEIEKMTGKERDN